MTRARLGSIVITFLLLLACVSSVYGQTLTVQIKTTPDQAVLPFEVAFEATATGGTAPYSHTWNFGDGISSTLEKPGHLYRESGRYTVWAYVADLQGNFGVAMRTITVSTGDVTSFDPKNAIMQGYSNTSRIQAILADRNDSKILWVGTEGGLLRFDCMTAKTQLYQGELPSANVKSLYQTPEGALWVGTYGGGLVRFDYGNNQWQVFNTTNSQLPHNNVYAIRQADDGSIWAGTDGGLARFDYGKNQWLLFKTSNSQLPGNNVYSLVQAVDGAIWSGTLNGLARFDYGKNQWQLFNTANSQLPENNVNSLMQAADGAVWVSAWGGGLARFDHGKNQWQVFNTANSQLPYDFVASLMQATDGAIWVGTYGGLARLDYGNNEWQSFNTTNSQLPNNSANSLIQAVDGAIWVGTYGGLARFDYENSQWQPFSTTNSLLPDNYVNSLMQAADGAIWVGTYGGLARFDYGNKQWQVFNNTNSQLPHNNVASLMQATDGGIWLGTNGGGLARFDYRNKQWQVFNTTNSQLPHFSVLSLMQAADGAIWVGTYSGLARFDYGNNQWQVFNTTNSQLPNKSVSSLLQATDGSLWIGTYGGAARFDHGNNQWQVFSTTNSQLPDNLVRSLMQTTDAAIWIGTNGGLARFDFDRNQWQIFSTTNSLLPDNRVSSLLQAADGAVWAGTYSGGLTRFNYTQNQWNIYRAENTNLSDNFSRFIIQSADGAIWMAGTIGLNRITFPPGSSSNSYGRLVLLAGGGAAKANTIWYATKDLALTAYRIFSNRGFANTDIYFISPEKTADFNSDGFDDRIVDSPLPNEDRNPTVADLRYAITDWAVKNYTNGSPLYVYLIDHGWPDDGIHGPYFEVAPGQLLYAKDLNEMLNTYEQATGGQAIIINESCYSGQFLPPLMKTGRIVFAATADKMANYDNWGTNSFTHFFLQKLFENDSLQQAYAKASNELMKGAFTRDQRPQLDDNGDGKSNSADGVIAASLKLGGDFNTGAAWPQILTAAKSALSGSACSFTAATNVHMRRVWAAVQPPNYAPDSSGSYQKIELETFDLTDPNATLTYTGTYQKFTLPGTYLVTIYARDQFGNTAVSDPVGIDVGMADRGAISGSVSLQLDSYQVSTGDAGITARIVETDTVSYVDAGGRFSITGVPAGTYTLRISGPLFSALTIPNVTVMAGQTATLTTPVVVKIAGTTTTPGDATGDNKLGLGDAIFILQTISGQRK